MTRKAPVLLLGCLLLSTSTTFGQARSEALPGTVAQEEPDLAKRPQAAPGQRAFFVLEGDWGKASPRELAFEIRIGERVMLRDVLQLPKDAVAGLAGSLTKGWDPVCLANCDTNRDWCYQTESSCEGVDHCDVCENEWSSCRNRCWICTDPKSVTERTRTWLKNAYWWGSRCLENVWQELHYYDMYDLVYQNDRIRRTEYCDGRVVETVLYSWDTYDSCIDSTPWTCDFWQGSAFSGDFCPF
jgi:hypothetical protein